MANRRSNSRGRSSGRGYEWLCEQQQQQPSDLHINDYGNKKGSWNRQRAAKLSSRRRRSPHRRWSTFLAQVLALDSGFLAHYLALPKVSCQLAGCLANQLPVITWPWLFELLQLLARILAVAMAMPMPMSWRSPFAKSAYIFATLLKWGRQRQKEREKERGRGRERRRASASSCGLKFYSSLQKAKKNFLKEKKRWKNWQRFQNFTFNLSCKNLRKTFNPDFHQKIILMNSLRQIVQHFEMQKLWHELEAVS